MKLFTKTLFFALLGGLTGLALAQSVPYPFNSVTSGNVTTQGLDAGTAAIQGTLLVGNDAGVGGYLYVTQGEYCANNISAGGSINGVETTASVYMQSPILYGSGGLTLDSHTAGPLVLDYNGAMRFEASAAGLQVDGGFCDSQTGNCVSMKAMMDWVLDAGGAGLR